jgi:hypothetical protein
LQGGFFIILSWFLRNLGFAKHNNHVTDAKSILQMKELLFLPVLDHYDLIRVDEKVAVNELWRGRSVGEVRV